MLPGTSRFWDYGDGTIPADRPECGFRNELCPEDNQGLLYNYYEKMVSPVILYYVSLLQCYYS